MLNKFGGLENIGDGMSEIQSNNFNEQRDNHGLQSLKDGMFEQNTNTQQSDDSDFDPQEYASRNGYFLQEFGKLELPHYP